MTRQEKGSESMTRQEKGSESMTRQEKGSVGKHDKTVPVAAARDGHGIVATVEHKHANALRWKQGIRTS
jgi:hypothetical protein